MRPKSHFSSVLISLSMALIFAVSGQAEAAAVSFQEDVRPILDSHCTECHLPPSGQGYLESGLDLTSYATLMKGTKYGSMIDPGHASLSNLMRLLEGQVDRSITMPHGKGKIPKSERNVIRKWINQGALDN